jgi:acetyl esterase
MRHCLLIALAFVVVGLAAGICCTQSSDTQLVRNEINEACLKAGGTTEAVEKIEEVEITEHDRKIRARLYRPKPDCALPVLLFFHGGGYLAGNLDTHDNACRYLCNRTPCLVLAVEYRLAPEHKFPTQPEDCYAATVWAARNAVRLGGDPDRLAVVGDSAGGTLAATICQWTRDRNGPMLRAQVLVNPALDLAAWEGKEFEDLQFFRNCYLHDAKKAAAASPLRADNFTGLPPAFIFVGDKDPLRAEGEAYVAKLRGAGVPATVHCQDGHGHLGPRWAAAAPSAREALDLPVEFLKSAFRPSK